MADRMEEVSVKTFDSTYFATARFKLAEGQRLKLDGSRAVLLVSVGTNKHYNGKGSKVKIAQALKLAADNGVAELKIVVADTLQRWNCRSADREDARDLAYDKGNQWIKDNSQAIIAVQEFGLNIKLTRWDTYINLNDEERGLDGEYCRARTKIQACYENDKEFRTAVQTTARQHADRDLKKHVKGKNAQRLESGLTALTDAEKEAIRQDLIEKNVEYLLEEITVIYELRFCDPNPINYIFYLNSDITAALQAAFQEFVPEKNILEWVQIQAKKRSNTSSPALEEALKRAQKAEREAKLAKAMLRDLAPNPYGCDLEASADSNSQCGSPRSSPSTSPKRRRTLGDKPEASSPGLNIDAGSLRSCLDERRQARRASALQKGGRRKRIDFGDSNSTSAPGLVGSLTAARNGWLQDEEAGIGGDYCREDETNSIAQRLEASRDWIGSRRGDSRKEDENDSSTESLGSDVPADPDGTISRSPS